MPQKIAMCECSHCRSSSADAATTFGAELFRCRLVGAMSATHLLRTCAHTERPARRPCYRDRGAKGHRLALLVSRARLLYMLHVAPTTRA